MGMKVDEAGNDIQARNVDDFLRLRCGNGIGDRRNLALRNGHVLQSVDAILRIDDVAAFQQQLVPLLRALLRSHKRSATAGIGL